jgi:hypothetical protein
LSKAAGEAERRRRARARKAQEAVPVVAVSPRWPELESALEDCPDPANHKVCPKSSGGHDWYKPHPRPEDHKYECLQCGHYDLDDYR